MADSHGTIATRRLAGRYRIALTFGALLLCYSNVWLFLYVRKATTVPPFYPAAVLIALTSLLALERRTLSILLRMPLLGWAAAYGAIMVGSFLWSSGSAVAFQDVRTRLLWLILLSVHLVLLADPSTHAKVRRSVLWLMLAGVAFNVWDLLHPGAFSPFIGRAAGLYINPNISACALTLGMLIALPVVPFGRRHWVVLAAGLGVVVTLSRAGVAVWLLIAALLASRGEVRVRSLLVGTLAGATAGSIAVSLLGGWEVLSSLLSLDSYQAQLWSRLTTPQDVIRAGDPSAGQRVAVLKLAWQLAGDAPLLGHGIGATTEWSEIVSTHNIYMRDLVEFGVFGTLLYPAFLGTLLWSAGSGARRDVLPIILLLAIWGLVSHNGLDDWTVLAAVGLTATARVESAGGQGRVPTLAGGPG